VVDLLIRQGHTVHAPTFTGLCERSHLLSPEIDLSTHVADIVNEVQWKDLHGIALCGRSYGGMVISGAVERAANRIASLVYLDAFVPENGQSLRVARGRELTCSSPPCGLFLARVVLIGEREVGEIRAPFLGLDDVVVLVLEAMPIVDAEQLVVVRKFLVVLADVPRLA
jgi:pimeloyl-ACP methyl ester carboxylesterase